MRAPITYAADTIRRAQYDLGERAIESTGNTSVYEFGHAAHGLALAYVADAQPEYINAEYASQVTMWIQVWRFPDTYPTATVKRMRRAMHKKAGRMYNEGMVHKGNYLAEESNTHSHMRDLLQCPKLASPAAKYAAEANIRSMRNYRVRYL